MMDLGNDSLLVVVSVDSFEVVLAECLVLAGEDLSWYAHVYILDVSCVEEIFVLVAVYLEGENLVLDIIGASQEDDEPALKRNVHLALGFEIGEFRYVDGGEGGFEQIPRLEDEGHKFLRYPLLVVDEAHLRETRIDQVEEVQVCIVGFLVHENPITGHYIGFFRIGEPHEELGLVRLYDDFKSVREESRDIRVFDIFLETGEFGEDFVRFYGEYRHAIHVLYRLVGDIDIGDGIHPLDDDPRR